MPTVTKKGQVTIPKKLREKLGIQPGDEISFEEDGEEVKIKKKVDENPFKKWEGAVETGRSTKEVMEELRGEKHSR